MLQNLRRVGAALVDFTFPLRCTGCGSWDTLLCDGCRANLPAIAPPFCARCGAPQPDGPLGVCPNCMRNPLTSLDAAVACYRFEGVIQHAIHDLKYRGISALAVPFGELLGAQLAERFPAATVVVPVPLHPARQRARGYNQALLLARAAAAAAALPLWDDLLVRTRDTPSQTALNAAGRRQNVRSAFACQRPEVAGQGVILVDDVITTGATLDACAATLKAAGARSVWACTLAREI